MHHVPAVAGIVLQYNKIQKVKVVITVVRSGENRGVFFLNPESSMVFALRIISLTFWVRRFKNAIRISLPRALSYFCLVSCWRDKSNKKSSRSQCIFGLLGRWNDPIIQNQNRPDCTLALYCLLFYRIFRLSAVPEMAASICWYLRHSETVPAARNF